MGSPSLRLALVASAAIHAALVGLLAWLIAPPTSSATSPPIPVEIFEVGLVGDPGAPPGADPVAPERGDPFDAVPGVGDVLSGDPRSPWPRADLDTPDPEAAGHGGGATGGSPTWTGRRDRDSWRAQPWNDPREYRLFRRRSGRTRTSMESIARLPDPGIDASWRESRRRAARGETGNAAPSAGAWDERDPRWDEGSRSGRGGSALAALGGDGSATRLGEEGAIVVRPGRPLVSSGDEATEALEDGPTVDDVDAAQASNENRPGAFDLTRPRRGGDAHGDGVAGEEPDDGASARARRAGAGEGGTRADVPEGHGRPSMRAAAQDAYMRRLYARVLARVEFPAELALALEQGEVTVTFNLRRDGSVSNVRIARSSGFSEFDAALVDAIRAAAPFGPVPAALVGTASSVPVHTPFSFENPLIR